MKGKLKIYCIAAACSQERVEGRCDWWRSSYQPIPGKDLLAPTISDPRSRILHLRGGGGNSNTPLPNKFRRRKRKSNKAVAPQQAATQPQERPQQQNRRSYNPLRMYVTCLTIVTIWITTGTLFYSFINDWPIPQSFFYAVDAGMSIGFCTDVTEVKLVSKAFTIVYILLGASVVGGALALFIQDSLEGIADNLHDMKDYNLMLEKEIFEEANVSQSGVLSLGEFSQLLRASTKQTLSDQDVEKLFEKFDFLKDGVIHFEEFAGKYRGIDGLIASLRHEGKKSRPLTTKILSKLKKITASEYWIYYVFVGWIALGVAWGMVDQGWDVITATHFAVSALATGGLTAPQVNSNGILPAEPAIFCGFYCLFGIPLMVVTLSHFARVLVAGHVAAMERDALTRPFTAAEYNVAKQSLTHAKSRGLHLGDFVTLQMLRQGRLNIATFNALKNEFNILDKDRTGVLTLQEATTWNVRGESPSTSQSDNSFGYGYFYS